MGPLGCVAAEGARGATCIEVACSLSCVDGVCVVAGTKSQLAFRTIGSEPAIRHSLPVPPALQLAGTCPSNESLDARGSVARLAGRVW